VGGKLHTTHGVHRAWALPYGHTVRYVCTYIGHDWSSDITPQSDGMWVEIEVGMWEHVPGILGGRHG
jgi:hypothetical protein